MPDLVKCVGDMLFNQTKRCKVKIQTFLPHFLMGSDSRTIAPGLSCRKNPVIRFPAFGYVLFVVGVVVFLLIFVR